MEEGITKTKSKLMHLIQKLEILGCNAPTHDPQSPAPGEPGGVSKWPFNKTDGSVSWESTDEILQVDPSHISCWKCNFSRK